MAQGVGVGPENVGQEGDEADEGVGEVGHGRQLEQAPGDILERH